MRINWKQWSVQYLLLFFTIPSVCLAQFNPVDDLENCKWRDGRKILAKTCSELRREVANQQQIRENQNEEKEEWQLKLEKKGAEEVDQYLKDLIDRSFKLSKIKTDLYKSCGESRKVNGSYKDLPCDPDNKSVSEIEQEKEEAVKKRKCGKDFMVLRVGMTLERIEQCYEEPAYVTETVGKGGVVETYRGTFYFIYVQNGRVIGYTRRTN